jgi:hypothetical protein
MITLQCGLVYTYIYKGSNKLGTSVESVLRVPLRARSRVEIAYELEAASVRMN